MTARKSMSLAAGAKSHRSENPSFLGRLLDPIDRLSETIFSVLIVLSFTLAYRVFGMDPDASSDYTGRLFLAALGATLAWGIIDGIMYALMSMFERGEKHRLLRALRAAASEEESIQAIADELDHILEPITREEKRRELYADMLEHLKDSEPQTVRLNRDDLLGAFGSVLVAVISVLPSLIPLLILRHDPRLAISASNAVSFLVLFLTGYQWGRYSGSNPWRTGLLLASISALMIIVAIPLGG